MSHPRNSHALVAASIATWMICNFPGVARGADTSWTNATGNAMWADPLNWSGGVPGPGDRAILQANAGTIDLGGIDRQAGTLSVASGFHLVNGLIDTRWLDADAGSTYQVFTSGPAMRAFGTLDGQIVDRPAGGGSFEVLLSAAVTSPQPYTGLTRPIQASMTGAGAVSNSAGINLLGSLEMTAPLHSQTALGTGSIRLLGGTLRLRSVKTMPLHLNAGPMHIEHGASDVSIAATGTFPPPPDMSLSVDSITRAPGATMLASVGFGFQTGTFFRSDVAPTLSGGGAAATERGILPYATMFFSPFTFPPPPTGRSFLTYDVGPNPNDPSDDVGLRPLNLATEVVTAIPPGTSAHNVRIAAPQTVPNDSTINSLIIPLGNAVTLDNASLTVSSGGIILGGTTSQQTGAMTVIGGSGALVVPGEAIVHADILTSGGQNRYVFDVPVRADSLTVTGGGSVVLNHANTLPAGVWVNEGYVISRAPGALGGGAGPIRVRDAELYFEGPVQSYDGSFVLDRVIDPLDRTFGYQTVIGVEAGSTVTFNGPVSGAGLLRASGPGTLRFNGDASFRNLSFVVGGTVEMNGTWSAELPGELGAIFFESNPTLAGVGTFLGELGGGGAIAPGPAGSDVVGTFTADRVRGNGVLAIQIDAQQADQLAVLTSLNLTGRSLDVSAIGDPTLDDSFRIIDVQFAGPITGTFTALPEGAILLADGWSFQITYAGGDGNDVVLTVVPEPGALVPLAVGVLAVMRRRRRFTSG